jgi:hypothetical protein
MKVSEILRTLAELVAKSEGGTEPADVPHQDQRAELHNVEVDNTDHTDQTVMVTPLQQKLELLKKAAGVGSVYDDECAGEEDELDALRKNAGIKAVVVDTLADGNDIEG